MVVDGDGPAVGVVFDGDALAAYAGFFDHAVGGVVLEAKVLAVFVDEGGQALGGVVGQSNAALFFIDLCLQLPALVVAVAGAVAHRVDSQDAFACPVIRVAVLAAVCQGDLKQTPVGVVFKGGCLTHSANLLAEVVPPVVDVSCGFATAVCVAGEQAAYVPGELLASTMRILQRMRRYIQPCY